MTATTPNDDPQQQKLRWGMPCHEQKRPKSCWSHLGLGFLLTTTVCTPTTTTIHQHNNQDGGRQLTNRMGLNDSVERRSPVSKPKSFIFISIFVLSTLTDDEHHHNLWDGGCYIMHKISSNKVFSVFPFPFSFSSSVFCFDRRCHDDDYYDIWECLLVPVHLQIRFKLRRIQFRIARNPVSSWTTHISPQRTHRSASRARGTVLKDQKWTIRTSSLHIQTPCSYLPDP